MIAFRPDTAFGELTINGLSMHTYAWKLLDIRSLYMPQKYRGDNVVIPRTDGKLAKPTYIDEGEHILAGYFTGVCDMTGSPYPDRFTGYETNIGIIRELLLTPPVAPDTTLPATIDTPAGDTLTADVQVLGFDVGDTANLLESPFVWKTALHLRIPGGYFS